MDRTVIDTAQPGYNGTGYVTNFIDHSANVKWIIPGAVAGLYNVQIRFSAHGIKDYDLVENGSTYSGNFESSPNTFSEYDAGNVQPVDGQNTIEIEYGWGHYSIDSVDLVPTTISPLAKPSADPVNQHATKEARALKAFLVSNYGKATLSGQHTLSEIQFVQSATRKLPAIAGMRFFKAMNLSFIDLNAAVVALVPEANHNRLWRCHSKGL